MILAIDIGNTNIVVGCLDGEKIYFVERISTDRAKTELEYIVSIKTVLELYRIPIANVSGAIIASVVPPLTNVVKTAVTKLVKIEPLLVGPGVRTGLNIKMENPASVGADLIVNAVAAVKQYGAPVIIIDMGTATTISVVDRECRYIGGMIMPGMRISLDALSSRTSQLPRISLDAPKRLIGTNTIDCMKSGIIIGQAASMDGMIDRIREEIGEDAKAVMTGGLGGCIVPHCKNKLYYDNELTLKGLGLIYEKNKPEGK